MSILKSEVKIGTVHELGCRLDDSLDAASKDMYRGEGASEALHQALAAFEKLAKNVDEEMKEGAADMDSARFVKRYIGNMLGVLTTMAKAADGVKMSNVGRVQAFKQAVQIAKQMKDDELAKLQLLQAALQKGIVQLPDGSFAKPQPEPVQQETIPQKPEPVAEQKRPDRLESTHPGMSLKQQRIAQVLVETPPPAEESQDEPQQKTKQKRTKK